jgi:hypothetical protein
MVITRNVKGLLQPQSEVLDVFVFPIEFLLQGRYSRLQPYVLVLCYVHLYLEVSPFVLQILSL